MNKNGFTIIEILVVITIVALLSTLAINGYAQYRRTSLLDLGAESLSAQVYELKERVIYGDFGAGRFDEIKNSFDSENDDENSKSSGLIDNIEEDSAKCFGIEFKLNSDDVFDVFDVKLFEEAFSGKKVWNVDRWDYKGCDEKTRKYEDLELDDLLIVEDVKNGSDASLSNFVMRYLPPDGKLELSYNGEQFLSDFNEDEIIDIKMTYAKTDYSRSVIIDLFSGNLKIQRN